MQRTIPRVSQILETSLYVDDLDRSRRFYERLFGFTAFFQDGLVIEATDVPLLVSHTSARVARLAAPDCE